MVRPYFVPSTLRLLAGVCLALTSLAGAPTGVALAEGFDLVGHLGGAPNVLAAQDGYLFLATGPELAVIQTAGPGSGNRIDYLVFPTVVQDVALTPDSAYAAVAAGEAGIRPG